MRNIDFVTDDEGHVCGDRFCVDRFCGDRFCGNHLSDDTDISSHSFENYRITSSVYV
jgi:hypothetical protein